MVAPISANSSFQRCQNSSVSSKQYLMVVSVELWSSNMGVVT